MDENYDASDLVPEAMEAIRKDCRDFFDGNLADIMAGPSTKHSCTIGEQAGHDFWLTRCGHGCGFWDGDWPKEAGKRLTDASRAAGGADLCVGDDGKVYYQ